MNYLKRGLLIATLLASCVGCDQITKNVARHHLAFEPPMSWFHGIFRLEYAENSGAFLSVGMGLSEEMRFILFQVLVGVGLIGLFIFMLRAHSRSVLSMAGWCLVLVGGGTNLLDRVLHHGRVIDFMNIGFGSLRTGIFNVADVCITLGVVLLVFEFFRQRNQPATE